MFCLQINIRHIHIRHDKSSFMNIMMSVIFSRMLCGCTDANCAVLSEQCEGQPCPADMQCVSIQATRGHYACQCPTGKLGECAGEEEREQTKHLNDNIKSTCSDM